MNFVVASVPTWPDNIVNRVLSARDSPKESILIDAYVQDLGDAHAVDSIGFPTRHSG